MAQKVRRSPACDKRNKDQGWPLLWSQSKVQHMRFSFIFLVLLLANCVTEQTVPQPSPSQENVAGATPPKSQAASASSSSRPNALPASGATTVASLGDLSRPGLWLETLLVGWQQTGWVVNKRTGKELELTLIPIPGASTSGSFLSVQAMQTLGVPLGDLVSLVVVPKV